MRLFLIRHGQTPANVAGVLDSAPPGPGLTELGEQQALALPDALVGEPIDSVSASVLVRTQLTAQPLADARGLEVVVRDGLHEVQAGDLEGRDDWDAIRVYLETAFAWGSGDLEPRMPGSEDGHEFFARFDAGIAEAERSGGVAVVVSHGAAIRVWVGARARNVPPRFAADNDLGNTGVVMLDGSSADGWTLLSWEGAPVGGRDLDDPTAPDPTGEALDEVAGG